MLLIEQIRAVQLPPPAERKAIRKAAGVSQQELASALGVQTFTVARWERGLSEPQRRHAAAYRRILDALRELAQ